jgi:hypothetical protein
MSSKAVAYEAMVEGVLSLRRVDGLRVEADDTTERRSESRSRSRFDRVASLRRRRVSSSSFFGADEPLSLLPVNLLHMMLGRARGASVWAYVGGDGRK